MELPGLLLFVLPIARNSPRRIDYKSLVMTPTCLSKWGWQPIRNVMQEMSRYRYLYMFVAQRSGFSRDNLSMHKTPMPSSRSDLHDARDAAKFETPRLGGFRKSVASSAYKFVLAITCLGMSGCGTTSDGSGMLDRGLQAVGLQRPQPEMPTLDGVSGAVPGNVLTLSRKITLRLHAGDVLNTDANGRSLSVVARIYKLRDKTAFESAPYADFQELKPAKAPEFAADVVEAKEIVLTPGKQYDVIETVGADAPYFAVVALFRAPAQQRWRFVFDTKSAASSGVTMGAHACALSVSAGQALDVAPEMLRVAGVHCPQT